MFEDRDLPCSVSWCELCPSYLENRKMCWGGRQVLMLAVCVCWGENVGFLIERHRAELEQGGCVDCVKFKGIISFICGIRATQLWKAPTAAPSGHLASATIISTVTPEEEHSELTTTLTNVDDR
ncbi:hypothetical protein ABVT39_027532 [Epinephelus coioides]